MPLGMVRDRRTIARADHTQLTFLDAFAWVNVSFEGDAGIGRRPDHTIKR